MRTTRSSRWVRAYVGDVTVVDSRRPLLFWEDAIPVPRYAFPVEDVRPDVLRPADGGPADGPGFFGPHGPVVRWYDIQVGDRTLSSAAWTLDAEELAGHLVVSWQPGLLDRWSEEDEEVAGHPRDPFSRVDALPSSRRVVVERNGRVLADSTRPVLLFETGLPTRYYLPADDVATGLLSPVATRSHCAYKGQADRYWTLTDDPGAGGIAWSYTHPFPAVAAIAGRIAFYDELVDLTVDGEPQARPLSPFSEAANRPGT